ncbi:hypothetical protein KC19_7G029600 [Ceratodon purpureus]|uniref:WRC domain-containing protein n=1 Tax=Ceratodon purpureus TaxID=3225 RepID=A0A8T0HA52_CERPU|nr:hypothetical protein KC19_7G029600 [Ceratodon purpureus]
MKIRKQFQKQAEEAAALLEPGDKKLSRQVSLETENGGRLLLGKSLFGDSSPTRKKRDGGATTSSSAGSQEGGAGGGGNLDDAAPGDQTTVQESLEESNSGSCGDWTLLQDDHNNAKRKYARRSLRSAGAAGTLVVQAGTNGYANGKAVVAKVLQRRSTPSRGELRSSGDKTGHPSEEPEGSLLHCLYLQLLASGSEGMTLKEIFASFTSQTRFSSLGNNWRDQVKSYLTRNSHFKGVKARYFLSEQLEPPPKPFKTGRNLMDLNVEPRASRRFVSPDSKSRQVRQCDTPLSASPDPSVVNNELEGVQTRRKTYERTIEAVLNESAVEFQKTQELEEIGDDPSTDELSTASRRSSDLHMAALTIVTPPDSATTGGPSKKRKSPSLEIHGITIPEPIDFRHTGAVPGSLKAMQARIVAETGVQNGARCSRKDGSNHHSKWQCPMMAMEGRSLCQHHNFLSERKKARYKKAKRQAAGKRSSPPRSRDRERDSQERAGVPQKTPVMPQLQDLNKPPTDSIENEELSNQIDEVPAPTHRIVRTRSDAHTNGSLAESANNVQTTEDMDSETEGGQLPLAKSRSVNPPITVPEPGRQSFRSTRKPRMYLAAKKTAEKTPVVAPAPGKSVKKQSVPLIRPPSIPPLPMLYGVRRKSMKNRPSQLTL